MPEMLFNLTGQKVLIIGGGSRMGLAVAKLAIALNSVQSYLSSSIKQSGKGMGSQ